MIRKSAPIFKGTPLSRSRPEGFTLLEVMLVLMIMVFVVAITYPSLTRGMSSLHLRASGRDILNTMRIAREKAITEQKMMIVAVDPRNQKVVLSDAVGDGARTYDLPRGIKISRVLLAGEEVRDTPLMIRFMTNGSCENAEIQIASDKGGTLTLVTDPITGGARIQSSPQENTP